MTSHYNVFPDSHQSDHGLTQDLKEQEQSLKEKFKGDINISIDSGMEDSINQQHSEDQEDDEEMVFKRKSKRMVIEDDDEEEDGMSEEEERASVQEQAVTPAKSQTAVKPNASLPDTLDDDPKLEFDDLDIDAERSQEEKNTESLDPADPILAEIESQNSNGQSDESEDEQIPLMVNLKNRELFDAESGEENNLDENVEDDNDEPEEEDENQRSDENRDQDEGFDENQIDPELLAKLKKFKGASKTSKQREKHNRKAKPSVDQMTELYGESQRLMRDSRINLPYYEPETKSLDDFLARASRKRQEYSSLQRPKDIQKALIIHERLSVKLPKTPSSSSSSSQRNSIKKNREVYRSIGSALSQELQSKKNEMLGSMCNDSGVDSQTIPLSQASTVILEASQDDRVGHSREHKAAKPCSEESDTELPDLEPVLVSNTVLENDGSNLETEENNLRKAASETGNNDMNGSTTDVIDNDPPIQERKSDGSKSKEASLSIENHATEADPPNLLRDPSLDLFASLSAEEQQDDESVQLNYNVREHHKLATEQELLLADLKTHSPGKRPVKEPMAGCNESALEEESYSQTEKPGTSQKKSNGRLALLEKLKQQGASLPPLPKLSGSPDSVIMLESDKLSKTPKNLGVLKLMDKLIQHSIKKKPKPAYDVNLSIVEKEGEDGQKKELKLKSVTYHVEEEKEELPSTAPGSKLLLLKEKLGKGMKQKREEARLRRQQLYNLENEEGYDKSQDGDKEEEEEAEMTDESDTDEDEDDDEEEMGFGNMFDDDDDGRDYNPLLDTEAREDDDEDREDYTSFGEESNDAPLRLELSDDENENEEQDDADDEIDLAIEPNNDFDEDDDDSDLGIKRKKKCKSQVLLSDSEEDEEINNALNNRDKQEMRASNDKVGFHFKDSWRDDLSSNSKQVQNHQFFRENSQSPELFGPSTLDESQSSSTRLTDNFNDSVCSFNPHSQMLDADGYLKTTQPRKPKSRIDMLVNATVDDDEALDIFESTGNVSAGKIFGGASGQPPSQNDNMAELMGLCSGKFQADPDSEDELNPSQNRNSSKATDHGDDLDFYDPFHVLSDNEDNAKSRSTHKRIKPMIDSDDDDHEDKDTDTENVDNEKKVAGLFQKSHKRIRKEFLDIEAELSGSEFDSDENLDLDEEDDILEEEEGDKDMAGISNETLRDEVGRVHMKQIQDQDDRDVMRFKEMYLQDGDLYGEGNGRMRNFKWKDMDESSQQDMFGPDSDQEAEEEDKDDLKWRKERYEREKFLEESEQANGDARGSQLFKLGQLFLKRQESSNSEKLQDNSQGPAESESKKSSAGRKKVKGSFLARSKEALVKIAQVAKTAIGGNSKHSSRNFLFQSIESQENQKNEDESLPKPTEPPKRKAHSNVPNAPAAKKFKVLKNDSQEKPSVKRQNSIFNLLDK